MRDDLAWPVAFAAVLSAAMVSATFLQTALGVLSVFVIEDVGLSRGQLGVVLAMCGLVGAASAPVVGRIVDAVGGRRVVAGLFLAAAGAALAVAVAPSYLWMLPASAVGGFALAAGNPATDKLIAVEVSPERRGGVVGLKQAGPPLGVLLAGAVLPSVAGALGWRQALGWSAVLPALGLMALWRGVPRGVPRGSRPLRVRVEGSARATMWWLTWIGCAIGTGVGGLLAFLPLYLVQELGATPAEAGVMMSVIGLLSVGGRIAWGWRAGGFEHVTAPLAVIAVVSVAATLGFWAAESVGVWLAWVAAVASAGSMMAWHAVGAMGVITRVGRDAVGAASGVVHLGSSAGFGIGPVLFGFLADAGGYPLAWAVTTGIFAIATAATLAWRRAG